MWRGFCDLLLTALTIERLILAGAFSASVLAWLGKNEWVLPVGKRFVSFIRGRLPGRKNYVLLKKLEHQLYPNTGGSMFDGITRIEENQLVIALEVQRVIRRMQARDDREKLITFITDEKGQCLTASKAYCDLVGLTLEEVLRDGWKNIFLDVEREGIYAEWESAIQELRDFHVICTYRNVQTLEQHCVRVDAYVARFGRKAAGWVGEVTLLEGDCHPSLWQG